MLCSGSRERPSLQAGLRDETFFRTAKGLSAVNHYYARTPPWISDSCSNYVYQNLHSQVGLVPIRVNDP